MILVRMGDDQAHQSISAVGDEAGIGHHHVHLGMRGATKANAAVHREPFAVAAVKVQVHAYLARPAQRQEGQITDLSVHSLLSSVLFDQTCLVWAQCGDGVTFGQHT